MAEVYITINKMQLAKIRRKFGNLKRLEWLKRPIKDSAWYMINSVHMNFTREGRPKKWAPWGFAYRKLVRERINYPLIILQLAGRLGNRVFALQLKRSISRGKGLKIKRNGFFLGTNVSYASILQKGGYVGPGRRFRIPARPFLMFQRQDITIIRKMFQKHVNKVLRS